MKNMMNIVKLILIVLIVVLLLIAITQNLSMASLQFLVWGVQLPVIVIAIIFLLAGFLAGMLCYPLLFSAKKPVKALDGKKGGKGAVETLPEKEKGGWFKKKNKAENPPLPIQSKR